MRPHRSLLGVLLAALVLALGACGSGDDGDNVDASAPPPAAPAADFPAAEGQTLAELQQSLPEGPILAPSVSVLNPGTNRVAFALFDEARKQVSGAQVAVYTARPDGSKLDGPFPARTESLKVKGQFESKQTALDPDAAKAIYVADVPFPKKGDVVIAAVAELDGRLVATTAYEMRVGPKGAQPPKVGEKAPRIDTPTVASAGGDVESIDTRQPPAPELHEVSFKDVAGKRPTVLIFATPQLCASRVCGPIVDVSLQVKSTAPDDIAWIMQEIYRENDVDKGFRPQVADFRLPSEPWIFLVDRDGVVQERFEGAVSVGELERALEKIA